MSSKKILKISFIAPTGFGKTTCAKLINDIYPYSINIKLAEPLYEMQRFFYNKINKELIGDQDGELLQFLGYKTQKECPRYLADTFIRKVHDLSNKYAIITNDDCRTHNYTFLKDDGFLFVKIKGIQRDRMSHTNIDPAHLVEKGIDNLQSDYELNNNGTINDLRKSIIRLIEKIYYEK